MNTNKLVLMMMAAATMLASCGSKIDSELEDMMNQNLGDNTLLEPRHVYKLDAGNDSILDYMSERTSRDLRIGDNTYVVHELFKTPDGKTQKKFYFFKDENFSGKLEDHEAECVLKDITFNKDSLAVTVTEEKYTRFSNGACFPEVLTIGK